MLPGTKIKISQTMEIKTKPSWKLIFGRAVRQTMMWTIDHIAETFIT